MRLILPPVRSPTSKPLSAALPQPFALDKSCVLALLPVRDDKWYDFGGKGNHGTLQGAVFTAKGRWGPGVYFDGLDDYVDLGSAQILPLTGAFTILWWCKPLAFTGNYHMYHRWKQVTEFFCQATPTQRINITFRGQKMIDSVNSYSTIQDKWTHFAVVFTGGDKALAASYASYINGVRETTTQAGVAGGTSNANIIGNDGVAGWYKGEQEEILVINRGLVAMEIKNIFEVGRVL